MSHPDDRHYTKDHEWVQIADDVATIGVTAFAQDQLGDIVYVELPEVGDSFESGEPFGEVESVKSVSELLMPLAGTVTDVNDEISEAPETVNTDCYGEGWFIRVQVISTDLSGLMNAGAYGDFCSAS